MEIDPINPSFIAKIKNIDLKKINSHTENADLLRKLLSKYKVLIFENQNCSTPEEFESISSIFGNSDYRSKVTTGYFKGVVCSTPLSPVHVLTRHSETYSEYPFVFGGDWHSDGSYDIETINKNAYYTMLYSKQIPSEGGNTEFIDLVSSYSQLPTSLQDMMKDWEIIHNSYGRYSLKEAIQSLGTKSFASHFFLPVIHTEQEIKELCKINKTFKMLSLIELQKEGISYPLFLKHPHTQEKALFINSSFASQISHLSKEESDKWLNLLLTSQEHYSLKYTLKWEPNMLIIWDNRVVNHKALPSKGERMMFRMIICDTIK